MVPLPRNTEQCRDKTICSLSSLLSGLFQALQCAGGWWSRGKFVYYFAKMLLIICHASRHIKAIVCTCHVVVKRESFILVSICKRLEPWICYVLHGNQKCTVLGM